MMKMSILEMEKKGRSHCFMMRCKDENPIQWANQLESVAQVSEMVVKCG